MRQEDQAPIAGEIHGFAVEVKIADKGVVDEFEAGAVLPHVVWGPRGRSRYG